MYQWSKGWMYVKTQLVYWQGVNETTCFGLLGSHHQVYNVGSKRQITMRVADVEISSSCLWARWWANKLVVFWHTFVLYFMYFTILTFRHIAILWKLRYYYSTIAISCTRHCKFLGSQNALQYVIYLGLVLRVAWWWLIRVETCCRKHNFV